MGFELFLGKYPDIYGYKPFRKAFEAFIRAYKAFTNALSSFTKAYEASRPKAARPPRLKALKPKASRPPRLNAFKALRPNRSKVHLKCTLPNVLCRGGGLPAARK